MSGWIWLVDYAVCRAGCAVYGELLDGECVFERGRVGSQRPGFGEMVRIEVPTERVGRNQSYAVGVVCGCLHELVDGPTRGVDPSGGRATAACAVHYLCRMRRGIMLFNYVRRCVWDEVQGYGEGAVENVMFHSTLRERERAVDGKEHRNQRTLVQKRKENQLHNVLHNMEGHKDADETWT